MKLIYVLVIFVILVLIASAFKLNLRGYIDSTPEQALDSNVVLVVQTGKIVWQDYIVRSAKWIWSDNLVPFFKGEWLEGLRQKERARTTLPPG